MPDPIGSRATRLGCRKADPIAARRVLRAPRAVRGGARWRWCRWSFASCSARWGFVAAGRPAAARDSWPAPLYGFASEGAAGRRRAPRRSGLPAAGSRRHLARMGRRARPHARRGCARRRHQRRASAASPGGGSSRAAFRAWRSSSRCPLVAGPLAVHGAAHSAAAGRPAELLRARRRRKRRSPRSGPGRCRRTDRPPPPSAIPSSARICRSATWCRARARAGRASPGISRPCSRTRRSARRRPTSTRSSRRATSAFACSSRWTGCPTSSRTTRSARPRWSSRRPRPCAGGSIRTRRCPRRSSASS